MSEAKKTIGSFIRGLTQPQVVRTCKGCDSTWSVPRYFARRRGSGRPKAGVARGRRGAGVPSPGRKQINPIASTQAADADLRAGYATCPSCGRKRHFSQHKSWFIDKS